LANRDTFSEAEEMTLKIHTITERQKRGAPAVLDLRDPSLYINRELSYIEFNRRVLYECQGNHPLLERVKFLAIFGSNLDEFFMVRVSGLKQQMMLGITTGPADGLLPREQLAAIHKTLTHLFAQAKAFWRDQLHPELQAAGIHILNYSELSSKQKARLQDYFEEEIFPVLTPLATDPARPFPHISNLSLNLATLLRNPVTKQTHFARLKVPPSLPRLVPLRPFDPDDLTAPTTQKFVWLEQVIAANLDRLFTGMEIVASCPFRVTRNAAVEIQEEEADDLLLTMQDNLKRRQFGNVVRLEIDDSMPDDMRLMLIDNLEVDAYDVYMTDGPLGLSNLWELHQVDRPDLKDTPFQAHVPVSFRSSNDIFTTLRQHDVLLHHPYDSFLPVAKLVETAAEDPDVLAIKMTLYRVGPNPPIVHALTKARENNKQVAVLVELKARFDEASNIHWANALEEAGVHVVYGLIGLKVHCKVLLIVRRERDGIRRYVHLATGNYNTETARVYTDIGFMSSDLELGADASDLFNFLTGYSRQESYRKFLVAPVNMRQQLLKFIERETEYGPRGRIIFKCNAIVDPEMIRALYQASQAGVKIDLLVRSICCLRPGLPGISDNIQVMSIVGRFLEHSRIYYFHNRGTPDLFLGSADLMPRNLDRRVEILFPVEDPDLRRDVLEKILAVYLRDTAQGHALQTDGSYVARTTLQNDGEAAFDSQRWLLGQGQEDGGSIHPLARSKNGRVQRGDRKSNRNKRNT
jgi:polyphosphate kinase